MNDSELKAIEDRCPDCDGRGWMPSEPTVELRLKRYRTFTPEEMKHTGTKGRYETDIISGRLCIVCEKCDGTGEQELPHL